MDKYYYMPESFNTNILQQFFKRDFVLVLKISDIQNKS